MTINGGEIEELLLRLSRRNKTYFTTQPIQRKCGTAVGATLIPSSFWSLLATADDVRVSQMVLTCEYYRMLLDAHVSYHLPGSSQNALER